MDSDQGISRIGKGNFCKNCDAPWGDTRRCTGCGSVVACIHFCSCKNCGAELPNDTTLCPECNTWGPIKLRDMLPGKSPKPRDDSEITAQAADTQEKLVSCRLCDARVSNVAEVCPQCGALTPGSTTARNRPDALVTQAPTTLQPSSTPAIAWDALKRSVIAALCIGLFMAIWYSGRNVSESHATWYTSQFMIWTFWIVLCVNLLRSFRARANRKRRSD